MPLLPAAASRQSELGGSRGAAVGGGRLQRAGDAIAVAVGDEGSGEGRGVGLLRGEAGGEGISVERAPQILIAEGTGCCSARDAVGPSAHRQGAMARSASLIVCRPLGEAALLRGKVDAMRARLVRAGPSSEIPGIGGSSGGGGLCPAGRGGRDALGGVGRADGSRGCF